MKSYVALALSAAAALALVSAQVPCSDITENVLTSSKICPARCGPNPCVLFSPSQKDGCIGRNGSAAGGCYVENDFQLSSSSDACDLTFQCLASLVVENKKWILALQQNKATANTTTTSVTEIRDITYPTLDTMTAVELAGGLVDTPREAIKNVILDKSFFATPPTVNNFFLSSINLPSFLKLIDYDKVKWGNVAWNNVNLDTVPAEFAKLDLELVQLRQNNIKSIDDASLLAKAVTIDLRDNYLTELNVVFPAAKTLLLSGNPLGKIPDAIFQMKSLKKLYLKDCNISNQQFTTEQFTFLNELQTFDADITITDCGSGYTPTNLTSNAVTVCAPGSAPSTDDGGSSSSVVIIVIIAVAVVAIGGVGAFCFVRRRRQPSGSTYTSFNKDGTMGTNDTEFTGMGSDAFGSSSIWNDPDLLAVRIEYRDVEPIKLLSRGGFGEVWLGLYMNENVAIKRLLADKKTMSDALAFAAEVKIMARLDHPKIVRFIGVAWTNALTIQAVTEFMDCGDLRSLLDSSRASSLTWANLKCQIAIDVADALVYLHTLNPKLIHRDLKSRNVLIDANTGAKLSDFGISRNRSVEETMTAGVGTARWIAPEVILGGHYTEFADIYSFGVVLSELDTNKAPFHDATNTNGGKMQDVTILQLVSAGKLQPSFTATCPEPIIRLAKACMVFDPAQRPSAIHISYELRKILKDEL